MVVRFILRSKTADGLPLYFGACGPTIARENAVEYDAAIIEQVRANAAYVFGIRVEVVAVGASTMRASAARSKAQHR